MTPTLRAVTAALLVVSLFGVAVAKLPAPPPPTEEQKAAAEAKKAKDAAAAEAAKQQQVRAEDRVVARYIAEQKAKGVTVTPQLGASAPPAATSDAGAKPPPASNTAKK
ncbi:MAG: hypothetical protein ACM3II_08520 [Rhodospirillaceae bacterium]